MSTEIPETARPSGSPEPSMGSLARRLFDLALARGLDPATNAGLKHAIATTESKGTRDIPESALMAVAELLAYIYGARTHWAPPRPDNTGDTAP
jgi:hypothetical protein